MKKLIMLLIFGVFSVWSSALFGVDVSQPISTSAFQCFKNNTISFVLVRCFQSNGQIDPNAVQTIKNARSVFHFNVLAYIVPCFKCGNIAAQVSAIANVLTNNGTTYWYDGLFIEVQTPGLWGGQTSNVAFIQSMVDQVENYRGNPFFRPQYSSGIKTSYYDWIGITGNSQQFSKLSLWYVNHDGNANFTDWASLSFGGWDPNTAVEFIKQYQGNSAICGTSVNFDYVR